VKNERKNCIQDHCRTGIAGAVAGIAYFAFNAGVSQGMKNPRRVSAS